MAAFVTAFFLDGWFWHPLRNGPGYNFWSGIAGCFLFSIPGWLAAVYLYVHGHICHVRGCWRLQWHTSTRHGGHPVCKKHHPQGAGVEHYVPED
jgi:hypothetical protein